MQYNNIEHRYQETCFDTINFTGSKYFKTRAFHIRSKTPLYINDYPCIETATLKTNSYAKQKVYEVNDVRLKFWKEFVLKQTHKYFPDYNLYIKNKGTIFVNNTSFPNQFNHVQFECVKDQERGNIWITMKLSYLIPVIKVVEDDEEESECESEFDEESDLGEAEDFD